MPQPTLSDVHVDRPLTTMSVAYQVDQTDCVAGKAFPSIPVVSKSDEYFIYNRGDFFRDDMQLRAAGTPAAGTGYKLSTGTYTAQVWALAKTISDQIRQNSDVPLNPDRDATAFLTGKALLNREVQWCSKYFGTGVWGGELYGAASASAGVAIKYWNLSGSTPIEDVLAARTAIKKATGFWPNKLVLGANTHTTLKTNPEIIDRLKYGQTAPGPVVVDNNNLAPLFEVEEILVTSAIKTTSGDTLVPDSDTTPDTFDFIGGNHALLCYAAKSPGLQTASAGYTFNWMGQTGSMGAGMRMKKYRWEILASDILEVEQAYAFGLVSKFLGYMFLNATQ